MPSVDFLVIGANGLIGRRLGSLLSEKGKEWAGTRNRRDEKGLAMLEITDPAATEAAFREYNPAAVFLCANLAGGVDFCEREKKAAEAFHLNATVNIASLCKRSGVSLTFISTDYVFDGTKGPYKEGDVKTPLNYYGRLKLEAEDWIRDNLSEHIIVRTTNVFGWDPLTVTPNYIMNLYRTITHGNPFNAPSYLWGNPTYVGDLAEGIFELHSRKYWGTFHVVGSSFINRLEWALKACEMFGLQKDLLRDVKEPPANIVPRPLRSWLDTGKFNKACDTVLHDAAGGLELMRKEMEELKA